MPTLRYLEYALALDEFGTHKRAALELHVSQPAISKGIAALEREYGVSLFERKVHPAKPTVFGAALLEEARKAVNGVGQLRQQFNAIKGLTAGSIRIGVGPIVASTLIGPAVARLLEHHPGIEVMVATGYWKKLLADLSNRKLDLYIGDLSDAGGQEFEAIKLPRQEIVWFCRSGHPILDKGRVHVSELLKYPLLVPTLPPWAKAWFKGLMGREDTRESPLTMRCDDYAILKLTVLNGNGVSGAPASVIAGEVAAGQLAVIPVRGAGVQSNAGIVTLRTRTNSPAVDALIAELQCVAGMEDGSGFG